MIALLAFKPFSVVALIVVVPVAKAETLPSWSTVATLEFVLDHVTFGLAVSGKTVALALKVSVTNTSFGKLSSLIVTLVAGS